MTKAMAFYLMSILVLVAAGLYYLRFRAVRHADETALLLSITHGPPRFGTLFFPDHPPTTATKATAQLCLEQASLFEKADLYMPDMGHGSEPLGVQRIDPPPALASLASGYADFGCYTVTNMAFFMPGTWHVRVFYKDGVAGFFSTTLPTSP